MGRMEGYGKEVDLWSTGVIMFLTLRAKLPFHDTTKNRIIARILRQNVQMVDAHWQKISKEAKDLISKLLIKNPAQRITCENAMKHPWFEPIREEQQNLLIKHNENKLVIIDEQGMNDEKNQNKKDIELYPDNAGKQSVKDIKVYDGGNEQDDNEDIESESDDDEDGDSAPLAILRQKSVHDKH